MSRGQTVMTMRPMEKHNHRKDVTFVTLPTKWTQTIPHHKMINILASIWSIGDL